MDGRTRTPGRNKTALVPGLALAAFGLALGAACGRDEGRGPASRVVGLVQDKLRGRPILRVEDSEYFNADFRASLAAAGADPKSVPPESLSRLFDRFVDEKILFEAARRRGISLSEDEKKRYVATLAAESVSVGEPATSQAGPAEGPFDQLLVEKYTFLVVRDVRVEEGEIPAYYEQHKKDFLLQGRAQVSQILVDTEEKAVSVLRRLDRAGEPEFRAIAREESLGPEAARGGVMGVFQTGDLPADMEKVIFALDEGRTSQVVESAYGFHVFRLDKKYPPALQTADEAAPEIQKRLLALKMKDALAAHLKGLKETMRWQALTDNLFFAYQGFNE